MKSLDYSDVEEDEIVQPKLVPKHKPNKKMQEKMDKIKKDYEK